MENIEELNKEVEMFKEKISNASALVESLTETNLKLNSANEKLVDAVQIKNQIEELSQNLNKEISNFLETTTKNTKDSFAIYETKITESVSKLNSDFQKQTTKLEDDLKIISEFDKNIKDMSKKLESLEKSILEQDIYQKQMASKQKALSIILIVFIVIVLIVSLLIYFK